MAEQYVNGRRAILQMLDGLLAEERNIKAFREVFQSKINSEQPDETLRFFKEIIMPVMPKDIGEEDGDDKRGDTIVIQLAPKKEGNVNS